VLDFRNGGSLFSLVNQVVLREAHDEPKMVVQCRGYAPPPATVGSPEVLVAFQDGINNDAALTSLGRALVDELNTTGFRTEFVGGTPLTAGYEVSCAPQAEYASQSRHKEFAILWLSPAVREAFRPQDDDYPVQVQLQALGIPIISDVLETHLRQRLDAGRKTRLPPGLKRVLDRYAVSKDIVTLQHAVDGWPEFHFSALLDRNSRQLLLLVADSPSGLPAVLNLQPRSVDLHPDSSSESARIDFFLASRSTWLEWPL
jgi:hypothetical protein